MPRPISARLLEQPQTRRSENAFLLQQEERGRHVLSVVRYAQPDARCPVVLDALVATEKTSAFEYECSVVGEPGKAVVALSRSHNGEQHRILKAWIVDADSLHFVPSKRKVSCSDHEYAGSDDGSDLLSRARNRANSTGR